MPTFIKIAGSTLTGTASSFTFSSIPNTYTNLYLIGSLRTNEASTLTGLRLRFNGDTGANYLRELLQSYQGGSGIRTETTVTNAFDTNIYSGAAGGADQTANFFSALDIFIPNYAGSLRKRAIINSGADTTNTSNFYWQTDQIQAAWNNTSAITTIELAPYNGSFVANSSLFLYGTLSA
jgi:hypothetical protein